MAEVALRDAASSGFSSRAARWIMVLVWGTGVLHGALLGQFSATGPWGVAAYTAALLGAVILTHQRPGPLSPYLAVALVLCAVFATTVVIIQYSSSEGVWLLKFSSYVVALAIPRGNPILGGIGGLALVTISTAWAIGTHADTHEIVDVLANPIMSPIAGFIWLLVTRRFVERLDTARRAAAESEARKRIAVRVLQGYRTDLADIREIVEGSLADIISGRELDQVSRLRVSSVEARVRDGIRAPQLREPRLDEAISAARERGVEVVVLGEPDHHRSLDPIVAAALVEFMSAPDLDRVTLRSLPPGREGEVSVVLDRGADSRYLVLPLE